MKEFSAVENPLGGSIPNTLCHWKHVKTIYCSQCDLHGIIPDSFYNPSLLSDISFADNQLTGSLPPAIGAMLPHLIHIQLWGNQLGGPLLSSISNCSRLKSLGMLYNNLSGKLALDFPKLRDINFISLGSNNFGNKEDDGMKFIGTLKNCTRLEILDLGYCMFQEVLPRSIANLIGNGGFSSIYKGIIDEDDDRFVAVKVLYLQNQGAQKSFMRECEVWQNIQHINLLRIIISCSSIDFQGNDFKALVYEFMSNGSLHDWLHSGVGTSRLNFLQLTNILLNVATALDYIRNHCIPTVVHGDLKPRNIPLNDDIVAHVGDFGLARFLGSTSYQNSSTGVRRTIGYTAPEYGLGSEMTSSGDVYSFGILLLEAMTKKKPTDDIFIEGFRLHKFAYRALPDHVIDVIDVNLLNMYQDEESVMQHTMKIKECLASMVKIGVLCSMESPQQRMEIKRVVYELQDILKTLQNI